MEEKTKINLSAIMNKSNNIHNAENHNDETESLLDSISNNTINKNESSQNSTTSEKTDEIKEVEGKKTKKLGKKTGENSIHLDSFLIHGKNINLDTDEENTLTLSSQDINNNVETKKDDLTNSILSETKKEKGKPKNYLLSLDIIKDEKTDENIIENNPQNGEKTDIKPKISLNNLKIIDSKNEEEDNKKVGEEITGEGNEQTKEKEEIIEEVKPIEEIKVEEVKKDDEVKIINDSITGDGDDENEEGEEEEERPKKAFINLNTIKVVQNKEEEKTEPIKIEEIKKEEEKAELFSNYVSSFKEKEDSLLAKIKRLKNLPKTRPLFLTSLILLTISGIGMLFYIDPKTHSIENYKTSILNIVKKGKDEIVEKKEEIKNTKVEEKKPPILKEETKEKVKVGGINLEFGIQEKVTGEKIYNYNGKIFNTKEELEENIVIEVNKIKKEKVRNILLLNYKKINTQSGSIIPIENENIIIDNSQNNTETSSGNIDNLEENNINNDDFGMIEDMLLDPTMN